MLLVFLVSHCFFFPRVLYTALLRESNISAAALLVSRAVSYEYVLCRVSH